MNKKTKKQLSTTTTQNTNVSITTTTTTTHTEAKPQRSQWNHPLHAQSVQSSYRQQPFRFLSL